MEVKPEIKTLIQDLGTSLSNRNYPWCILTPTENDTRRIAPATNTTPASCSRTPRRVWRRCAGPARRRDVFAGKQGIPLLSADLGPAVLFELPSPPLSSDTLWVPDADPCGGGSRRRFAGRGGIAMTRPFPIPCTSIAMLLWTVVVTLTLVTMATTLILHWPAKERMKDG